MTILGGDDSESSGQMGDVGIGTTTPTEKLHVEGTIKATKLKLGSQTLTETVLNLLLTQLYITTVQFPPPMHLHSASGQKKKVILKHRTMETRVNGDLEVEQVTLATL